MTRPRPNHRRPSVQPLSAAVAFALMSAAVQAQQAAATEPADGLKLDAVVVTGTSTAKSKMRSSVAISTIESEGVAAVTAASSTDLLRGVPGIRAEASGGESNANVAVRGIPVSAGGARYIQFQEDGLPVLQFGDIAFATPDTWMRADAGFERLEVVRGGSAALLATGAPGGIINFIGKTGLEEGGSLQLTKGLDFEQTRVDFGYGGRLAPKTRFFIGGFYRVGDGGRQGADGTENGGQVRGNLTFELQGKSYVRFSFKHLDDHTPTFMPTPVKYVNGSIQEIPGLDPRRAAFYDVAWPLDSTLTKTNARATSNIRDGLSARSDAFGADLDLDAGGGFRLQNKFSWSRNSGRFIGIFPGDDVAAAPAGTTLATGPDAGAAYTGAKFTAVVFNTRVDNAGLMANDLKFSRDFDLGGKARLSAVAGLYTSVQQLDLTWNFNQYSLSASGEGARVLNVPGIVNGSPGFGGCCSNTQDSKYTTNAPYLVLNYEAGPLSADIGLRRDNQKASGAYYQSNAGVSYDLSKPNAIDYDFGRTSYSLGGNYALSKDLSVFARYSDGAAYNADRITFFNNPNLVNGKSPTIPTNKVRQAEAGVKIRGNGMSLFATLFHAKTDEVNVDVTTNPIVARANSYRSNGLELEGSARFGVVNVLGGLTYTDAKQADGRAPKRQAKVVYQLTPTVNLNDALTFGVGIVGTTKSLDDGPTGSLTITLPAYTVVNAFASYALTERATLSLAANNLFNELAYTESNDGRGAARAYTGRTVKASLRYSF
ncbi:outer membrane receptor protein involved in Fe transport [Pelomonas saccharophila]|uniref:Outer membrane receptor protein involved in Fe transport n=1 Tax=Roseateles saccharophilus TaxID=304 RepID=A0ABU1YGR3_ROSSA|nr:TonB-dependent receptor [Roseateles saccharophilus]MDR7268039.1 outer membrane receptor protein involved in Fe transport [Roseateles saccharophilus]